MKNQQNEQTNVEETSKFRFFLILTRALGDAFWEAKKFEDRPREMDPGPLLAVPLFRNFACAKKVTKKDMPASPTPSDI